LTPSSLVAGNPRLNLAFVANLFNTHPGLEPLDEQEAKDYGQVEDFDAEGEREARVFTLWLNSLGVEPGVFNLFENLKDGLIILQAFDKILPGSVVWRRVSKPKQGAGPASYASGGGGDDGDEGADIGVTPNQSTLSRFKAVENTNYSVELAKQSGMHMVGIQGADIVDGNKTLVLGLVWQLMRYDPDLMRQPLRMLIFFFQNEHYEDSIYVIKIVRWKNDGYGNVKMGEHNRAKGQSWSPAHSFLQRSVYHYRIIFP
jgi:plastin-1